MLDSQESRRPTGITFQLDTLFRSPGHGDNWCMTWAADNSVITSMCDGDWLQTKAGGYHNHLYRILGGPVGFSREDLPGYPDFSGDEGSWFGYGIVSVEGVLYSAVSRTPAAGWSGPFRGVKLLRSDDNGRTWYRVDRNGGLRELAPHDPARNHVSTAEMFFLEESGIPHRRKVAYPFSYFDFVQCGRDNSAAKDDFLYIYSPEGAHAHLLMLARVPKDRLGIRSAWEYFTGYEHGEARWSSDIQARRPVYEFPEKSQKGHYFGWYSWLPSVVWNPGLNLYIMVNGGTYAGHGMTDTDEDYYDRWMHTETGSLGFWYAEHPYGPWHEFFYTDYWFVDSPENRTYQPKLSPKWISESGQEMVLIWSDAMKNELGQSHTTNYTWNQMSVTLKLA